MTEPDDERRAQLLRRAFGRDSDERTRHEALALLAEHPRAVDGLEVPPDLPDDSDAEPPREYVLCARHAEELGAKYVLSWRSGWRWVAAAGAGVVLGAGLVFWLGAPEASSTLRRAQPTVVPNQDWDRGSARLVGSIDSIPLWVASASDGRRVCLLVDTRSGPSDIPVSMSCVTAEAEGPSVLGVAWGAEDPSGWMRSRSVTVTVTGDAVDLVTRTRTEPL